MTNQLHTPNQNTTILRKNILAPLVILVVIGTTTVAISHHHFIQHRAQLVQIERELFTIQTALATDITITDRNYYSLSN